MATTIDSADAAPAGDDDNSMRLRDYVAIYAEQAGILKNTARTMRGAVSRLERFACRRVLLADLTEELVESWVEWLRENFSRDTARTNRADVMTLWRAAYREKLTGPIPVTSFSRRGGRRNQPPGEFFIPAVPGPEDVAAAKDPELLVAFFEQVYVPLRLRGRAHNTLRLYRASISSFSRTMRRRAKLSDLTDENLSLHLQRTLDYGLSIASAEKDRNQLGAIWRFANRHGYVTTWPEIQKLHAPERIPTAWTPEDLARLLQTIEGLGGYVGRTPRNLWWRAMVLTCLDSAERIGAIAQVHRAHFDPAGWLTVPAEARKGRRRDRIYKLRGETVEALQEIRPLPRNRFLFPWPFCKTYLWTYYDRILQQAGLPYFYRDKFHRLRRTVATAIDAAGGDAQLALDHADRRTTVKYIDPRLGKQEIAPADILDDYQNPSPRRKPR